MHPNPIFRSEDQSRHIEFARSRGFGQLAINADPAPLVSHIPFILSEDGKCADFHLVRSTQIARAVNTETPAVLTISGSDGYVSPDWYGIPDQVPTWNYIAVHLRGQIGPLEAEELRGSIDRLTAFFEAKLAPKTPWVSTKMQQEALNRMMRMIRPFRFDVASVDGTWKLNQNKTAAARKNAATEIQSSPIGMETGNLAQLMQSVLSEE